jgi:hypothetical protein
MLKNVKIIMDIFHFRLSGERPWLWFGSEAESQKPANRIHDSSFQRRRNITLCNMPSLEGTIYDSLRSEHWMCLTVTIFVTSWSTGYTHASVRRYSHCLHSVLMSRDSTSMIHISDTSTTEGTDEIEKILSELLRPCYMKYANKKWRVLSMEQTWNRIPIMAQDYIRKLPMLIYKYAESCCNILSVVLRNVDLFLEIVRSIWYSSDIHKDCNTKSKYLQGPK